MHENRKKCQKSKKFVNFAIMLWQSDQPADPTCSVLEQSTSVDMEVNHTNLLWGDSVWPDWQFSNLAMEVAKKGENGIFLIFKKLP